jgi:anti-sigma B factor antagonist
VAGLTITERSVAGVTILELDGRLVLEDGDVTLRDYVNRLVDQDRVNIVLDMRHVTQLDSSGIGVLAAKYLSAYRRGGRLKLLRLTLRGGHLMTVTKLSTIFEIFESEDEAIRSFEPEPA